MKFEAKVESGTQASEYVAEVVAPKVSVDGGKTDFLLDGEAIRVDWAATAPGKYSLLLEGQVYDVRAWKKAKSARRDSVYLIAVGGRFFQVELQDPRSRRREPFSAAQGVPGDILAPMPGKIVKLLASEGLIVAPGQGLLVIEAMKMQNEVRASRAGRVEKIHVREGEGVEAGSRLVRLV